MVARRMRGRALAAICALALLVAALAGAPSAGAATPPPGPRLGFASLGSHGASFGNLGSAADISPISLSTLRNRPAIAPLTGFTWVGGGESLAFVGATRNPKGSGTGVRTRLYLLPAAGGRPVAIPHTEGGFEPVAFPDGRTIAFVRTKGQDSGSSTATLGGKQHTVEHHSRSSIWLVGTDGSGLRRLTPWVTNPIFERPSSASADGRLLAVTVTRVKRGATSATSAVEAIDVQTGQRTRLATEASGAIFSPDGSRLAFVHLERFAKPRIVHLQKGHGTLTISGRNVLEVEALATGAVTPIVHAGERPIGAAAWDPSGQRLAYIQLEKPRDEGALFGIGDTVMEVNPDGSCATEVLHEPRVAYYGLTWQPGTGREAGPLAC